MQRLMLGQTELEVSRFCYGTAHLCLDDKGESVVEITGCQGFGGRLIAIVYNRRRFGFTKSFYY